MAGDSPLSAFDGVKKQKTAQTLELSFKIKWSVLWVSEPKTTKCCFWERSRQSKELAKRVLRVTINDYATRLVNPPWREDP